MAGIRQAQDDVGAESAAIVSGEAFLSEVILSLDESGGFEETIEDEFAPRSAGLGLAFERVGEGVGFVGDTDVELAELLDLRFERGAVLAIGFVNEIHTLAEVGELLAERSENCLNLGFVVVGEFGGFFL